MELSCQLKPDTSFRATGNKNGKHIEIVFRVWGRASNDMGNATVHNMRGSRSDPSWNPPVPVQATSDLMSSLLSVLLRIFKTVVLSYAVVATVYTLLVPLVGYLPLNSSLRVGVDFLLSPSRRISELGSGAFYSNVGPGKLRWAEEPVCWRPSPNFFFKTSPRMPLSMTEELFLNKAFSQSLQPTNIVPFYYRSSKSSEKQPSYEDISIATLVTSSRFMVLAKLARKYQGTRFSFSQPMPP